MVVTLRRLRLRGSYWLVVAPLVVLPLVPAPGARAQSSVASADLPDAPGFLPARSALSLSATSTSLQSQAIPVGAASISGLITDVNGGIVPGATISILGAAGKPLRSTTADSGGKFRLDELPPGTYLLRIDAAGLESYEPPAVVLKEDERYMLPDTALPIATAHGSVDVVATREEIAQEELNGEVRQRVLGVLPNFYTSYVWDAAPLTRKQKFRLTVRALTDPFVFARTGITAGIQEYRGTYPEYACCGFDGFAQRYAAAYGDVLAGRMIGSAILPSIFKQDPRYFYRGTGGVTRRAVHALFSSVTARGDNGGVQPNYTQTLGDFSAGYLSRTWHQGSDDGLTLALNDMLVGIASKAGFNLLQEFLYKRISIGTPPFAKGKPPEEQEPVLHP